MFATIMGSSSLAMPSWIETSSFLKGTCPYGRQQYHASHPCGDSCSGAAGFRAAGTGGKGEGVPKGDHAGGVVIGVGATDKGNLTGADSGVICCERD